MFDSTFLSIGLLSLSMWLPCCATQPVPVGPPKPAVRSMIKVIVHPPKVDYKPGFTVTLFGSGRLVDPNGHSIPENGLDVIMRPEDKKPRYVYLAVGDPDATTVALLAKTIAKLKKAAAPGHETIIIVYIVGMKSEE
jgi:hypothetical protein